MVAAVEHAGLPRKLEAGVARRRYALGGVRGGVEGQTLAARFCEERPVARERAQVAPPRCALLLAAAHKDGLAHGDLKLENVIIARSVSDGEEPRVALVDVGIDKLRPRAPAGPAGERGFLGLFVSPKTMAPEIARGKAADARSDVYAFGVMLFELLVGKPPFAGDTATDVIVAHLIEEAELPSERAPRGWVTRETDDFVAQLLQKDPALRPRDAQALLDQLESLGRASTALRAAAVISDEKVEQLVDDLIAEPGNTEAALALDNAIDEGANPTVVAEAFEVAADQVNQESLGDDWLEVAKGLLFRAGRIFDNRVRDKARAEKVYEKLVALDARDEVGWSALEEVRRGLGKYEAIVEMLLERSEAAGSGEERARAKWPRSAGFCATELNDVDQALVAFARALCERPLEEDYAGRQIERLAGTKNTERWKRDLEAITEGSKNDALLGDRAERAPRLGGALVLTSASGAPTRRSSPTSRSSPAIRRTRRRRRGSPRSTGARSNGRSWRRCSSRSPTLRSPRRRGVTGGRRRRSALRDQAQRRTPRA